MSLIYQFYLKTGKVEDFTTILLCLFSLMDFYKKFQNCETHLKCFQAIPDTTDKKTSSELKFIYLVLVQPLF